MPPETGRWRVADVSRRGPAQSPAVALDDSGAGIVAFRRGHYVRVAALSARGWGYPRAVGPAGPSGALTVSAAIASSGAAAVIWAQHPATRSDPAMTSKVFVARRRGMGRRHFNRTDALQSGGQRH